MLASLIINLSNYFFQSLLDAALHIVCIFYGYKAVDYCSFHDVYIMEHVSVHELDAYTCQLLTSAIYQCAFIYYSKINAKDKVL